MITTDDYWSGESISLNNTNLYVKGGETSEGGRGETTCHLHIDASCSFKKDSELPVVKLI